jgi:hypothetical protein
VPLSENEQRILQDIERSFYENDPGFARTVSNTTLYRHAGRNCKWAVAGFVVSLIVLVVAFTRQPIVGFVAFVGMLASAVVFVQNIRRIGAAGLRDVADSDRAKQVNESIESFRDRLRKRFPGA